MMSTLFYLFLTIYLVDIINICICSDNKQLFPLLQLYLASSQAFPLSLSVSSLHGAVLVHLYW